MNPKTLNDDQPTKVLLDINVILDVLSRREPFYRDSAAIWRLAENGYIVGMLAAHSITTLYYLYTSQTSPPAAVLSIEKMLDVFRVAAIDQSVIETALQYGWADFEDAVQMAAAEAADCNHLVTRNPKDFEAGPVQSLQPADFLAIISARSNHPES